MDIQVKDLTEKTSLDSDDQLMIQEAGGVYKKIKGENIAGSTLTLDSGTYTPVISSSSHTIGTIYDSNYLRVGDIVTVSGRFNYTSSAALQLISTISLPIASTWSSNGDCSGTSNTSDQANTNTYASGYVGINVSPLTVALLDCPDNDTSGTSYCFYTFTYKIN